MECVCVRIIPKKILQNFSILNPSSIVYFDNFDDCLLYISTHPVDVVFTRNNIPQEEKKEFSSKMLQVSPSTVVIDVDEETNDYMLMKPVSKENLEDTLVLMKPITEEKRKDIYIRTFGRFCVFKNGNPCRFSGKAKEILALLVTRRGKEVSNEEIYTTLWEERPYSNRDMIVYYNALRRLKDSLKKQKMSDLLISASHGQMVNTRLFDCDYYDWLDGKSDAETGFEGEFLSEYSWGEYILSDMINRVTKWTI